MVEISSPDQLEEWLKDKPIEWAQVIALRCSLRIIPILNLAIKHPYIPNELNNHWILSVFRASLISEVAVYSSTSGINDVVRSAAYAARSAAHASRDFHITDPYVDTFFVKQAVSSTAFATRSAADAARAFDVAFAARSAVEAARAFDVANIPRTTFDVANNLLSTEDTARAFDVANTARANAALNHDLSWLQANFLEKNSPQILLLEKLWYRKKNSLVQEWDLLKSLLLKESPGWQFWTDWYQAIRDGSLHTGLSKAQQDELYYKIATFPNELWEEGA